MRFITFSPVNSLLIYINSLSDNYKPIVTYTLADLISEVYLCFLDYGHEYDIQGSMIARKNHYFTITHSTHSITVKDHVQHDGELGQKLFFVWTSTRWTYESMMLKVLIHPDWCYIKR